MKDKITMVWNASILVIVGITLINTVCSFTQIDLSLNVERVMGVIDLIAVAVLCYTSVKIKALKKAEK